MTPSARLLPLAALALLPLALTGPQASAQRHFEPEAHGDSLRRADVALPGLSVPFSCGQAWTGATRRSHSPDIRAVDFNRPNDEGSAVVASAAGTVTTAYAEPRGGYGRWVVLDHGGGVTTLYAHLKKTMVVPGQSIDKGALIGLVGSSGNSTGAHLHYEQLINRAITTVAFGGVPFASGALASDNCVDVPLAGNFAAGPEAEVAVFRRDRRSTFEINDPAGLRSVRFGGVIDEPVIGDFDGDGLDDLGLRSPRGSKFKLRTAAGVRKFRYGVRTDRPVAGDWAGTGVDQVGVHRPSTSQFLLRNADGTVTTVALGDANDLAVTGDWNGDRRTDVGVYDRATSVFTLATLLPGAAPVVTQVQFGTPGDLPVVGDWDGNGVSDLGTWTPGSATFVQSTGATADARQVLRTVQFGRPR